jgi:hypothetical protein
MKLSRTQIGGILLAIYGLLQLALLATGDIKIEDFGLVYNGNNYSVDATLYYLQLGKWVVAPALALVAGVLSFIPAVKAIFSNLDYYVAAVSLFAIVAVFVLAGYAVSVFDADFGSIILGYPGEEFTIFGLARIGLVLVFAALVLSVLDLLKRFGVDFSFGSGAAANATSGLKAFMKTLLDASLENFISRKVSGVLYIITAWLIILSAALLEVLVLLELLRGNILAFFGLLLVPVFTLLALIIVRMAFEAGIALIVIAENTKK